MARKVTEDDTGIQLFYEPPTLETASNTASIDIIAIHGIGAHPDDTWRKKVDAGSSNERYVNWLRDTNMLPAAIPKARIMRYGYESHWFGETIKLKASTVAQRLLQNLKRRRKEDSFRPLIFIAHCFGGLVVLKAIVDAKRSESKWPGIYQSTCGILFFGTPFRGAAGLNQTELLRAIQSQYEDNQIQGSNLNILDPGNETLVDLVDMFLETRQEKNKAHIACFFELKPSKVGAIYEGSRIQFVVNESSGCLDPTESTEKFSLSRDHFNMNKFGKSTEEDFETVREVKEDMVKQAPVLMKARNQENSAADPDQSFQVQFDISQLPVTRHFVARDKEMKEIEFSLISEEAANRKVHVLYGLGGIGKTQLAIAYAQKYQEKYSAIVWVNGNNQDTVLQSLAAFARNSKIVSGASELSIEADHHGSDMKNNAQAGLQWLARKKNCRWLMIFDNVDQDYQTDQDAEDLDTYDLASYFPRTNHGSILVTTRLSFLGDMGKSTEVTRLNQKQAINILSDNSRLLSSAVGMKDLVSRLGCLPLAIVQAGRYIRETGTNCVKYQLLYDTSWSELLAKNPRLRDYANGSVQTTWMISYDRVWQVNATAAKLLQLWAHFHYHDLWFELFHTNKDLNHPPWVLSLVQSEIEFMGVMKTLLAYSLVECSSNRESYSIHPVVHDWCRESIGRGQIDLDLLALIIVGHAVPDHSKEKYWLLEQRLLPHANQCRQNDFRYDVAEPKKEQAINAAFHHLGALYYDLSKFAEAEKMYQRALNGYKRALGPDLTLTVFETVNNLGGLYKNQGRLAEAEKMYQQALDGKENAWGPHHISTLVTVFGLGGLYVKQSKLAEAEKMYQRALDGFEKAWGPDHTSTLETVASLGVLYKKQSKLAEAEKMYQRALDGLEKALGPDHISTLCVVHNLGIFYNDQGKPAEAEKMYLRALDGFEKAWGPDHTFTLKTVNNLGLLYNDQSKQAEAEKMFQRALNGFEKALGPDHTSTLDIVNTLGVVYYGQDKLAEAEKMYQRALDGYEKAFGPDHTSTLKTVNNLGALYEGRGKLAEAENMYQRALDGFEKALGPDHSSTLETVNNLGVLYEDQGKLAEAEMMYQRALDGLEKALGLDHTSTLNTVNNLGRLYLNHGKLAEAEKMFQRALNGYEKALGPDHSSTLTVTNNLRELNANVNGQGDGMEPPPEATKLFNQSANTMEKRAPNDPLKNRTEVGHITHCHEPSGLSCARSSTLTRRNSLP